MEHSDDYPLRRFESGKYHHKDCYLEVEVQQYFKKQTCPKCGMLLFGIPNTDCSRCESYYKYGPCVGIDKEPCRWEKGVSCLHCG